MRNAMIVVLLALPVGWLAFGQPDKKDPPPTGTLTSARLGKLLKDLGYEPSELSAEVYQVSLDREGWKVHVMVSLTAGGDRVWFESKFAPIAQPEAVPASAWRKLLEENDRIGPAHFTFDKNDKRIHLYKSVDNVGLVPARLKKELDAFDATVRRTQAVWRAENFAPGEAIMVAPRPADAPADEAAALRGKWRVVRVETRGESVTDDRLAKFKPSFTIDGDRAILKLGLEPERAVRVKIDPTQKPKRIDFVDDKDRVEAGIYLMEAGLLTVCVGGAGEERPRQFITDPKSKAWLLVLKRDE
jgi:uncharacterized protein (TIGR03067 family)